MGHYKSNLRDIEFNLFEVFDSGSHYGSAAYPEIDVETARTILAELDRLAVTELAESIVGVWDKPAAEVNGKRLWLSEKP